MGLAEMISLAGGVQLLFGFFYALLGEGPKIEGVPWIFSAALRFSAPFVMLFIAYVQAYNLSK